MCKATDRIESSSNNVSGESSKSDSMKKKVRFGANSVRQFSRDFSDEEWPLLWYTTDDCDAMESEINSLLYRRLYGLAVDESKSCLRGLELRASPGRYEMIKRFVEDVLDVQKMYKEQGRDNTNELKEFADKLSQRSRDRSQITAEHDAANALRIYAESFTTKAASEGRENSLDSGSIYMLSSHVLVL